MKVPPGAGPLGEVPSSASSCRLPAAAAVVRAEAPAEAESEAEGVSFDFRAVYEAWFESVSRWVRALGGAEADRDDIIQEVFVVVRRRLPFFEGTQLAPWLYRITQRRVRDFRRRSWVTRFFNRRCVDSFDQLPSQEGSALEVLERKEEAFLLERILGKMRDVRRATFVLFEIEGLSGEEIAALQQVPLNTVWTRLHHARREFAELAARLLRAQGATEDAGRWRWPSAKASGQAGRTKKERAGAHG